MKEWTDCVGDGWAPLVKIAEKAVIKAGGEIDQVKEKFGGLRIYVSKIEQFSDTDNLIDAIQDISIKMCEYCGAAGYPDGRPWIKTLCADCHAKREAERNVN